MTTRIRIPSSGLPIRKAGAPFPGAAAPFGSKKKGGAGAKEPLSEAALKAIAPKVKPGKKVMLHGATSAHGGTVVTPPVGPKLTFLMRAASDKAATKHHLLGQDHVKVEVA